jgi:glycosyltransferase involved in cell wall biosynthesis
VTFINNFPGPSLGGGEVQLLTLLRGLSASRVRATVVCAEGSALDRQASALGGVRVVPVDFAPLALLSLVSTVAAGLPAGEIVQGTGFLTNLIARCVGARTHAPVVNVVHVVSGAARLDGASRSDAVLRATLDRVSRRHVSHYVAVSQAAKASLLAEGVPAGRITVIPNGLDLGLVREQAASAGTGDALLKAPRRVGCVGRLERVKGTEYFLRAAALLAARHPDARFVVAGAGSRDHELRALAADLGVADHVEFTGYVATAPALIASLDVVVVPSLSEASGLIAAEAMALEVPVVASFVGGLSEVVENGTTGLLVPPADPEAIARAVARLLDNPEVARRLAAEARRRADERFGMEAMAGAYLAVYEELSAAKSQRA